MRRNPTIAVLVALLLALAVPLGTMIWKTELGQPVTTGVAVLPFENLSDEKENAFFADGVQDDVLTKLAKVADLKVISRTSVMQYRGKQDVRQIGNALRVSHVLEGTVRRFGGKVHVNAQLVDARTDTGVWAEEYDRDLNDVFAIEAELAQSIANRLRAKVSAREKAAMQEWPTKDLVAYDFYVRARPCQQARFKCGRDKRRIVTCMKPSNYSTKRSRGIRLFFSHIAGWLKRTTRFTSMGLIIPQPPGVGKVCNRFRFSSETKFGRSASGPGDASVSGYLDYDQPATN